MLKNRRFIFDLSLIYRRYFATRGDFFKKISNISPCADISPIFWWYLQKYLPSDFSPRNIVSTPPDTRYIDDISPIYPDIFLLARETIALISTKWMTPRLQSFSAKTTHPSWKPLLSGKINKNFFAFSSPLNKMNTYLSYLVDTPT